MKNNKALENLNEKVLESRNDESLMAPYLASAFVNLFEPENKSHYSFIKKTLVQLK